LTFAALLPMCLQEILQGMKGKDYRYEDSAKDLEQVIALIEGKNAFILDDILNVVSKFSLSPKPPPYPPLFP
jgi:hypothetical protein